MIQAWSEKFKNKIDLSHTNIDQLEEISYILYNRFFTSLHPAASVYNIAYLIQNN